MGRNLKIRYVKILNSNDLGMPVTLMYNVKELMYYIGLVWTAYAAANVYCHITMCDFMQNDIKLYVCYI